MHDIYICDRLVMYIVFNNYIIGIHLDPSEFVCPDMSDKEDTPTVHEGSNMKCKPSNSYSLQASVQESGHAQ